jgi:Zn-dependent protease with chaperone function
MNPSIDPNKYVAPGTKLHSFIGWSLLVFFGPILFLVLTAVTYGIFLIGLIIAGLTYFSRVQQMKAKLRGSALQVNEYQFPEIYHATLAMSERLGLPECPEIYIVEDNQQNAFSVKKGSKHFIILIDDMVYGAMATGNPGALNFILGHELAHHALGHTSFFRSMIRSKYSALSRLDELSCDGVAYALVGDLTAARDALALLLVGPQLFKNVNKEALDRQAREVIEDKHTKKAERSLSHPFLLRRYARLQELTNN